MCLSLLLGYIDGDGEHRLAGSVGTCISNISKSDGEEDATVLVVLFGGTIRIT